MTPLIPLNDTPVAGPDESTEQQFVPPTPEQRAQVSHAAHLGLRPSVMAALFGVSLSYLAATFTTDLSPAVTAPQKCVLRSLYELAVRQKSASATIFWLKNFASHLLPPPQTPKTSQKAKSSNKQSDDDLPPKHLRRLQFSVYNNDGEPNYPY